MQGQPCPCQYVVSSILYGFHVQIYVRFTRWLGSTLYSDESEAVSTSSAPCRVHMGYVYLLAVAVVKRDRELCARRTGKPGRHGRTRVSVRQAGAALTRVVCGTAHEPFVAVACRDGIEPPRGACSYPLTSAQSFHANKPQCRCDC